MTLKDAEQLALIDLPAVEANLQFHGHPVLDANETQRERVSLENKYRDVFEQRLDWRRLVTYVPNKQLPVYNWFKYKEGFSRELVMRHAVYLGISGQSEADRMAGFRFAMASRTKVACDSLT